MREPAFEGESYLSKYTVAVSDIINCKARVKTSRVRFKALSHGDLTM